MLRKSSPSALIASVFLRMRSHLGGNYEVINYVQFLDQYIENGALTGCYHAGQYPDHLPRSLLPGQGQRCLCRTTQHPEKLTTDFVELERNKSFSYCCGAGGAQMFKEAESGEKEVFIERTEEVLRE